MISTVPTTPTAAAQVTKQPVFIGSSSEALGVLNRLVVAMSPYFEPRPWTASFTPGRTTLEVLAAELGKVHACLLIFAKDDTRDFRGDRVQAARDNVVLEYGFFVSQLGAPRVWILEEEGVGLPSDVLGLTTFRFSRESEAALRASIDICIDEMRQAWLVLPPPTPDGDREIDDADLGFATTLQDERSRLTRTIESLRGYAENHRPRLQRPLTFDSSRSAISAYSEALDRVQRRFWTTTFLSSGFWTRTQAGIIEANARMLRRLHDTGGQARRLFLLDQPPHMVAEAHRQHRVMQRQLGKNDELERFNRQFENLKINIRRMTAEGFETRVVFDENQLFQNISDMLSDPTDNELAIYDDFRVDVFEGGRLGVISRVMTYTPLVQNYAGYLRGAEQYFQDLWESAESLQSFLDQLQQAVDSANAKIDYESNWLAMYEFDLDAEDQTLKTVEIERTKEVLRRRGRWGTIRRYLDVGMCTGRYPIQLRDAVVPDGEIIAIDEDYDCFRFADANRERQCPNDQRITMMLGDFGANQLPFDGPFNLITCMLGTLSHFGWRHQGDATKPFDDLLQRALTRMASLLTDDGLLMLGTWSEHAKRETRMLKIYRQMDRQRLALWTPGLDELKKRLAQADLRVIAESQPEVRLDFTVCMRAG
ncbi:MAG: nucleotide-binding protein [Pseudonocardiales bacterium]|nr:nucleotide-binding protein [Pseudonocardiales bacterium]